MTSNGLLQTVCWDYWRAPSTSRRDSLPSIPLAGPKPHRGPTSNRILSSKYRDRETTLLYHDHRYYNSLLGLWLSRDPIEEDGGGNLYVIAQNDLVSGSDVLGLQKWHGAEDAGGRAGCCCCCVNDVRTGSISPTITWAAGRPHPPYSPSNAYGYQFEVETITEWIPATRYEGDCKLEWWEWSNVVPSPPPGSPPSAPRPTPYTWWDKAAMYPGATALYEWHCRARECGVSDFAVLTDRPHAGVGFRFAPVTMVLFIAVRVRSADDCPCPAPVSRTKYYYVHIETTSTRFGTGSRPVTRQFFPLPSGAFVPPGLPPGP
jgi:RHS repeat-associated protein